MGREAHSLQALKGYQGSWPPEGKARFQSHWQACLLLGSEGGPKSALVSDSSITPSIPTPPSALPPAPGTSGHLGWHQPVF